MSILTTTRTRKKVKSKPLELFELAGKKVRGQFSKLFRIWRLVFQIPIGTSYTNWYFKYQLGLLKFENLSIVGIFYELKSCFCCWIVVSQMD
jgi:hypothetical protein